MPGHERDFARALQTTYDELTAEAIPSELDLKLRDGIAQRVTRRRTRRRVLRLGTTAAVVVTLGLWWLASPSPRAEGPFVVLAKSDGAVIEVEANGTVHLALGEGSLFDRETGTEMQVSAGSRVRKTETGPQVLAGRVTFKVRPRRDVSAKVRVLVSGGVIEVAGTRFEVIQREADGSVQLYEGSVRFVDRQGRVTKLKPGDTWAWGRTEPKAKETPQAMTQPSPDPPRRAPTPVARPPRHANERARAPSGEGLPAVDAILARISELRTRGRYEEAVAELTRALAAPYSSTTRERLSFERGSILTYVIQDMSRACTHWREHQQEFVQSGYSSEIERALVTAGCGE